MARDFNLPLRKAIVSHLRADAGVIAQVPAARVYGMRQPPTTSWPFTRYGQPDSRSSGLGEDIAVTLHSFSKAAYEDECAEILSALVESLDGAVLTLEGGEQARVHWRGSQIIPDAAEANAWHGLARFDATIAICA